MTSELERTAYKAIIGYAFFRLESALTISLSILLAFFLPKPFPWWHWWYWLAIGAVFEALIVVTSIRDERTAQRVVRSILRERHDPRAIRTKRYREKVEQALVYRDRIQETVAAMPVGLLRDHLYEDTAGVADWIGRIYALAKRLDAYERDELIHRDMGQVPASIRSLEKALQAERDETVRLQILATIRAKREQQANLDMLQKRMEEAGFLLEETITALGTAYSQFQLVRDRKQSASDARRLTGSIQEQVKRLQDILESMDRVYGPQAPPDTGTQPTA